MRRLLAAGAACALALAAAGAPHFGSAQSASSWPTFHGDISRDGISTASGPKGDNGKGQVATQYQLTAPISASLAVDSAGNAYVGDKSGHFYAFGPTPSATPKWVFPDKGAVGSIESSPTLSKDGSLVFFGSDDGHLYALNTSDGTKKWAVDLVSPVTASPLLSQDGSQLFVPTTAGTVYALSASNGSTVWSCTPGVGAIPISMSASPDGGTLYFGLSSGFVYGIPSDWHTCSGATAYYLTQPPTSTPAIDANGNFYIATAEGHVMSFAPGNAQSPRWDKAIANPGIYSVTSPTFVGGLAVFGAKDKYVRAWNTSNGDQAWQFLTGGAVGSSPAVTTGNNEIFVGSDDGYIYALSTSGQLIWKYQTGAGVESSPAVAPDGSIWVATLGGTVYHMADIAPPPTLPATVTPGPATSTPTATATSAVPTATATATATSTPTKVPLTVSAPSQVKPGKKVSIDVTSAPNTLVKLRIDYPNGDHQSGRVTTGSDGKGSYSYKQAESKIKHNSFTATVTAKAGSGTEANSATATYKIEFGTIDVSAEPRSVAMGKKLAIFVHAKARSRVQAFVLYPSGRLVSLPAATTGPKGFVTYKYTVPKGAVSKHNVKVTVLAKLLSNRRQPSTKTTFTIT